ncbi:hypothetical protein VTN77DRAFT_7272 [Rasamsonia byssochlamydoides]|uniref:uncharacterized protein n=1 Tax=Rasamsonia byssochlamydoides TaxID=89139 RepID=UPI003742F444
MNLILRPSSPSVPSEKPYHHHHHRTRSTTHKLSSSSTTTSSEDIHAILSVTNTFLNALHNKSRADFEKCCFPAGWMSLCGPALVPLRFISLNSYIKCITSLKDDLEERIWDPDVRVSESGNLAMVWAPFQAKINGHLDHVGVNLFVMHKIDGRWKISGLADSWWRPTAEMG